MQYKQLRTSSGAEERDNFRPRIKLDIESDNLLDPRSPFYIHIRFTLLSSSPDSDRRSILINRAPTSFFIRNQLQLAHLNYGSGLVETEEGLLALQAPNISSNIFSDFKITETEVAEVAFGRPFTVRLELPQSYRDRLKPGLSYNLVWLGGKEAEWWGWGTLLERWGETVYLQGSDADSRPTLVVSNDTAFRVSEDTIGKVRDQTPKLLDCARIPSAPMFSLSLSGSDILTKKSEFKLEATITYIGESPLLSSRPGRPIIFNKSYAATDRTAFSLLHHTPRGVESMKIYGEVDDGNGIRGFDSDEECGFPIDWDTQDTIVGKDRHTFASLLPGQSVTSSMQAEIFFMTEEKFIVGDTYTYRFDGDVVTWWDWGTFEDHKDTKVQFGSESHTLRPKIVLPASNEITFTVKG